MVQYISEMERKKCKIISEIFSGLCKALDIVIMDTGKYGFVKMQYDDEEREFINISTFIDGDGLFEALWKDWLNEQLFTYALRPPYEFMDYEEIFEHLPKKRQTQLMAKRIYFRQKLEEKITLRPDL